LDGYRLDVFEAIKTRRSIRRYRKEPIPEEVLLKVLEAGRWAPSAKNSQLWNFIVLKDEEIKRKIAEVFPSGRFLADAACGIAVVTDPKTSNHAVEDGAAAAQNMLLAAHALGLGACWLGVYGGVYEEKIKEILNVPKEKFLVSIISLGFPAETLTAKPRKSLEEILFVNRYGEK